MHHTVKKPKVFHPFLVAVLPSLFLLSHNIEEVLLSDVLLASALSVALAAFLWLILIPVFRSTIKAALLASLVLFLLLSYGHIVSLAAGIHIGAFSPGNPMFLSVAMLATVISAAVLLFRSKGHFYGATNYLNITAGAMIAMSLFGIGQYAVTGGGSDGGVVGGVGASGGVDGVGASGSSAGADRGAVGGVLASDQKELTPAAIAGQGQTPDVYYIILDGYTNNRSMRKYFGFDNSAFLNKLRKRGFVVRDDAHPNYSQTYLSLASSLNMRHVTYLERKMGDSRDRKPLRELISNNAVARYFRAKGYKIVHFKSGWGPTDRSPLANINYSGSILNETSASLLETTVAASMVKKNAVTDYRNRILYTFRTMKKVPSEVAGAKFVFAHVLAPHPPYVFTATGGTPANVNLKLGDADQWAQKRRYVDQTVYVNKLVLTTIDRILATSARPPIIIIQGDHGAQSVRPGPKGRERARINERMNILNAYYLPRSGSQRLYRGITPVNSFRLIRGYYFGDRLPLVSDSNYWATYQAPYRFQNVTGVITR